jgi:hypothetical protein
MTGTSTQTDNSRIYICKIILQSTQRYFQCKVDFWALKDYFDKKNYYNNNIKLNIDS